jgi:hypothetical protein
VARIGFADAATRRLKPPERVLADRRSCLRKNPFNLLEVVMMLSAVYRYFLFLSVPPKSKISIE